MGCELEVFTMTRGRPAVSDPETCDAYATFLAEVKACMLVCFWHALLKNEE
jgi:hypothetical protein